MKKKTKKKSFKKDLNLSAKNIMNSEVNDEHEKKQLDVKHVFKHTFDIYVYKSTSHYLSF